MGADEHRARLADTFRCRPFRVLDAVRAGVPRHVVYRLRDRGDVVEVGRGLVQFSDADPSSHSDLALVCARAPHGTICLNSALSYWDLSDALPGSVDLAIPRGSTRPAIDTPRTTIHSFASATFETDRVRRITEAGEPLWIYSAERSIVDAMRLAHHVGRDVALHALNRYMRLPDAEPLRLAALSRELGGARRMSEALETLLS